MRGLRRWLTEFYWKAWLSDGSRWTEHSRALVDPELSPWRALQRHADAAGLTIMQAEQRNRAGYRLRLEARGAPLQCGQGVHQEIPLDGGAPVCRTYRFVCRLESARRVWAVLDAATGRAWGWETDPGDAMCPDPLAA